MILASQKLHCGVLLCTRKWFATLLLQCILLQFTCNKLNYNLTSYMNICSGWTCVQVQSPTSFDCFDLLTDKYLNTEHPLGINLNNSRYRIFQWQIFKISAAIKERRFNRLAESVAKRGNIWTQGHRLWIRSQLLYLLPTINDCYITVLLRCLSYNQSLILL